MRNTPGRLLWGVVLINVPTLAQSSPSVVDRAEEECPPYLVIVVYGDEPSLGAASGSDRRRLFLTRSPSSHRESGVRTTMERLREQGFNVFRNPRDPRVINVPCPNGGGVCINPQDIQRLR
jgi:hypothetical protein